MKKYKMKTELWCSQPHIAAHLQAHTSPRSNQRLAKELQFTTRIQRLAIYV
jgi:hypothetical protein